MQNKTQSFSQSLVNKAYKQPEIKHWTVGFYSVVFEKKGCTV